MPDSEWSPWFAWHRVNVDAYHVKDLADDKIYYPVFWRWVERRRRMVMPDGTIKEHWQYRLPQPKGT